MSLKRHILYPILLILTHLSLAQTQCDDDADITVFVDPSNPLCTKLSEINSSSCICCGYAQDNLFNYQGICTVGTPNDLTEVEVLIRSKAPSFC